MAKRFKKDAKKDFSKPKFELLNPKFLEDMAKVLTVGAQKYGANNFMKAKPAEQKLYIGAIHRHLNQWQQGVKKDEETNVNHLVSVAINAMFLYYFDVLKDNE
jgi:hypothetical protein